jgi:hypothetical protein
MLGYVLMNACICRRYADEIAETYHTSFSWRGLYTAIGNSYRVIKSASSIELCNRIEYTLFILLG